MTSPAPATLRAVIAVPDPWLLFAAGSLLLGVAARWSASRPRTAQPRDAAPPPATAAGNGARAR